MLFRLYFYFACHFVKWLSLIYRRVQLDGARDGGSRAAHMRQRDGILENSDDLLDNKVIVRDNRDNAQDNQEDVRDNRDVVLDNHRLV